MTDDDSGTGKWARARAVEAAMLAEYVAHARPGA